ncbi:MAG: transcription-repair coupling factor, partial [Pseudomonadota bacterium]|nr:transcription-repair coupling factor [Pseudomonadota bacterium]
MSQRPPPVQPLALAELPPPGGVGRWGRLHGGSQALLLAAVAQRHPGLVLAIAPDSQSALRLESELAFFTGGSVATLVFPDWETLPYDVFSPHQDIVSQRLATLYRLPARQRGMLIVPVATLMQRLAPRSYLDSHALLLRVGERLDLDSLRQRLEAAGYACVSQVMEHGEFAVRGSLLDLYPAGAERPYRIDLLDDEVESIRTFDPDSQLSIAKVDAIELLPAREFPLDKAAITRFRQAFRTHFEGDPQSSPIYREVSNGNAPGGIEYYLPLFFEATATLFDYLPATALAVRLEGVEAAMAAFHAQIIQRYEQRRHDRERPLLPPHQLFLEPAAVARRQQPLACLDLFHRPLDTAEGGVNFPTAEPPALPLHPRAEDPAAALHGFLAAFPGRVLLAAESAGHREVLAETLEKQGIRPAPCADWGAFVGGGQRLALTVAALEQGLVLEEPPLAVIVEAQLFGDRPRQARRRGPARDAEAVIRNLADLSDGAPVVHEDYGVGRYAGLQRLQAAGIEAEFVVVNYAGGERLYVPVAALHKLSRYTGASPDHAPLHKLSSDQWARARRKAAQRVTDAAAELLDLYARRQVRPGHAFKDAGSDYAAFAAAFPFEETPDQEAAIAAVSADLH